MMNTKPIELLPSKLFRKTLNTPLGKMLAIANERALYVLDFLDRSELMRTTQGRRKTLNTTVVPGSNKILELIQSELSAYFAGALTHFSVPIQTIGTPFQQRVWNALCQIPYGSTCSYATLAAKIGQPTACRAVANANGGNRLSLIVPCHRVIRSSGELGGYGGGLDRKQFLLAHEEKLTCIGKKLI